MVRVEYKKVRLPEALHREAKSLAVMQGLTLSDLITKVVQAYVAAAPKSR